MRLSPIVFVAVLSYGCGHVAAAGSTAALVGTDGAGGDDRLASCDGVVPCSAGGGTNPAAVNYTLIGAAGLVVGLVLYRVLLSP